MEMNKILNDIMSELDYAKSKYKQLNSGHEGYAVIKEEVDELWDMVKASKLSRGDDDMRRECIQIAAMAIRFIEDLC